MSAFRNKNLWVPCVLLTLFILPVFILRRELWPTFSFSRDLFPYSNRTDPEDHSPGSSEQSSHGSLLSKAGDVVLSLANNMSDDHPMDSSCTGQNLPSKLYRIIRNETCNLYNGTWVKDAEYPLYLPHSCPYVDAAYSCQENGRPDRDYMKWRWKPDGCHVPRFNASDFLERLRGKRLMLVGDSMNRNQFESLLCLFREGLSDKSRMYETRGYKITKGHGHYIFLFLDYNCTVEFIRSHFLVREGTRLNSAGKMRPTLLIDQIDKSAGRWKMADILIFNTGHWWNHGKTARGQDYFQVGDHIYPHLDVNEAFRRAMRTWGKWVKKYMDSPMKLLFYRGYSASHFRGGDWDSGGTCYREAIPITDGTFLDNYPLKMTIIEEVIEEMKLPVVLLNITKLTNYRKDGHPSVYGERIVQRQSARKQDCSHWCLPGVPDAWNELIYTSIVMGKIDLELTGGFC